MLCSICNENPAVIFVNKKDEKGESKTVGYCMKCAKEQGINPIENIKKNTNLTDEELKDVASKLDQMLKGLAINIKAIDEEELNNLMNQENIDTNNEDGINALGSIFDNMFENSESNEENEGGSKKTKTKPKTSKKKKALDAYGTNLTLKAKNNQLDRVIGRDQEIERMIQILNRRSKNNPCLIGEPGVGKTAIAQALAIRIAEGNVPAKLLNKEVYLLDMTSVVAGTQFRGQFEARMKSIIEECKLFGNIILVIDEIHSIIGAGDAEHGTSAANILKPALTNGEIQLIGTTTLSEYRKYIEKDAALERRFQPVKVEEPSESDTIEIIKGIKQYYENYHHVKISNEVIEKTVSMSEKYIHDRFLPDKAIDILDEACSKINLNDKDLYNLEVLNTKLKEIQSQKEEAAGADSTEDYQRAAELKTQECNLLEQIENLKARMKPTEVTVQDIANVIESWTKIPVNKITEEETKKLLNLENNLHNRVIGQNEAVEAVSRAIRRSRAGLKSTKRPPSFIFVGPTGVGKTELAKAVAYEIFGSEKSIIRFDMSEYMESNSVAKLIGAPPGYVGYDEAGQLTDKVKRNPYSIVLFDEIEKANSDVFNILLQILDDGRLTDSKGRTVDFKNCIIILTSNVGATTIRKQNRLGFGMVDEKTAQKDEYEKMKETIMVEVKKQFRPEFLNRIDDIVVFHSLTKEDISSIVILMCKDLKNRLKDLDINLEMKQDAIDLIAKDGIDLEYGARPLKRSIQNNLENELSELILQRVIKAGDDVVADVKDDKMIFTVQ